MSQLNDDPALRELLAPMTDRPVDLDGVAFQVDRRRVLARMARASQPRRLRWLGALALVATGAGAVVLGMQHWPGAGVADGALEVLVSEGSATLVRGSEHEDVSAARGARVSAAGELETADGSKARVRAADGLQIELGSKTRVALGELQARASQVKLIGGAIRCVVPHRAETRPFQVVTPDVTVVDLGTVFTVSLEGPTGATRVSVEEGEVLIRHARGQTRVQAPGSWSSSAPPAAAPAATITPTPVPEPTPRAAVKATTGRSAAPTLDLEARLLRQGLASERQGRFSDAQAALAQLLRRYPRSPLAPDARAALVRVEASARR